VQRIAITGATGYIGGRLVPRLLDAGYAVRCLVRSPRKLSDRPWAQNPHVETVQVDLEDAAALTASLQGCDAAYFLVHSMVSAGAAYAEKDLKLATGFATACKNAGVQRIIYLGGLGEMGDGLSEHLTSRREVEKALNSAGVPVTTLRAAMIIGSGSASFEILRYLVQRLPVMVTPKWVITKCQPIAVRNVLAYLAGLLEKPETAGETYDIGGPEVLTYHQIMNIMAEELKLPKRVIIPLPILTPTLSSYWIHLVTPLNKEIARPLAEGLRNPVIARDDRITKIIPQKLLTVREAIAAARSKTAEGLVETSWSMAGPIPGDPDWAGGTVFSDEREVSVDAPAHAVFQAVCMLGGAHGWYSSAWLWRIRGGMDRLVGGPGLRRGRVNPDRLSYGEALDFWRVVGIEKDRSLLLRAEMRLPGTAALEFCITPVATGSPAAPPACSLKQTARFQPKGLWGIAYWYGVLPFHGIVFKGMLDGIKKQAVKIASTAPPLAAQQVPHPAPAESQNATN
jgi:uncharacterized protein YbjT (DUF2867 family)